MAQGQAEREKGSPSSGTRLRKRPFPAPVLSLGTQQMERWARIELGTKLRKLRRDLRQIVRERRTVEEELLVSHPLMAFHQDGRHLFEGTDLDQQFHA